MLLHLGPNVITFRTLLHLGPNVITFRTLLHLGQLLHLGLQQHTPHSKVREYALKKKQKVSEEGRKPNDNSCRGKPKKHREHERCVRVAPGKLPK